MSEKISLILKDKLNEIADYKIINAEIIRNILKEELQLYLLNFIYNHPEYNKWIMYGGSALRIVHGLNRMSIDLDFEISHSITKKFLEKLKNEIENYFKENYELRSDFLAIKISGQRGLLLKFNIGEKLNLNHPSKQVHLKIDLNHFVFKNTINERHPINQDQFSFVILTYNMSTLMASKLSAIFLRGFRGVGKNIYFEKGRDIYDLLWYMNKKIIPNIDYMKAKGVNIKDPDQLFEKLNSQINKVKDENLKNDLFPLFINSNFIENWLKNWKETYFKLIENYKINNIELLDKITINQNINNESFSLIFNYHTNENEQINISYHINEELLNLINKDLNVKKNNKIENKIVFPNNLKIKIKETLINLAFLFYKKNENYFKKTNNKIINNDINTKIIRLNANNLNRRKEIILTKNKLITSQLEDLLK